MNRTSPSAGKADVPRGEPLLVLEGIAKSHDGDTQLFQDISVTVCRGERFAIVGANGSGAVHIMQSLNWHGPCRPPCGEALNTDHCKTCNFLHLQERPP